MKPGERITYWRKRRGVTKTWLAAVVGVCAATITRFENGETQPTAYQIEQIAAVFNLSMAEFYCGFKPVFAGGPIARRLDLRKRAA